MKCSLCSRDFDCPEYEADKASGRLFGGMPGTTCDEYTDIIINGNPEDIPRGLLDALAKISLAEADSSTSAVEKVRDMARIARRAIAAANKR